MTYEEAIELTNKLVARERAAPESVSDEEIAEAMNALRSARAAAPGAKKSRAKSQPVDLGSIFGGSPS